MLLPVSATWLVVSSLNQGSLLLDLHMSVNSGLRSDTSETRNHQPARLSLAPVPLLPKTIKDKVLLGLSLGLERVRDADGYTGPG